MDKQARAALNRLEAQVQRAGEALRQLREENERLRRQLGDAGEPDADAASWTDGAWQQERAELRRRLERLTQRLEALIAR